MNLEDKRRDSMSPDQIQAGNRSWWTANPMTYDWHRDLRLQPLTPEWFDAIDREFLHGCRLFATTTQPFDRIIPLDALRGRKVLEIGCGMGLHTETMVRAGAEVTAVDLTPTAIEATSTRLRLKGLQATIRQADAEQLPFEDGRFDFAWSWGVIHHSARTARIVREIARVLRPGGACRVMVYNRSGMPARVALLKDHIARGGFLRRSFEETLFRSTDGYSARFYVRDQAEDLFRAYFRDVDCEILGQDADVVPLPRQLRALVLKVLPRGYLERAQARRGAFLLVKADRRE